MKRTIEEILADTITDTKATMAELSLLMHEGIEGLVEAGKAGAKLGKTLREYAVAALEMVEYEI